MSAAMVLQDAQERERAERHSRPSAVSGYTDNTRRLLAEVYAGYETVLQENNALDFDDLLIYGVKLFKDHQAATRWCNHILVDELLVTSSLLLYVLTQL